MVGRRRRRASQVVGAAIVIIGVLVVPASMASAAASITVNPSTVTPGDTVTISGNVPVDACTASDPAQLTSTADLFPPDGFGPQAPRDASGDFTTTYAIPASIAPGTYSIGIRCGGGNVGVTADLQVAATGTAFISVSPTTEAAGASASIAGGVPITACPAGETAQLTSTADLFPPDGFGPQVTRDASGNFTTSYTIPASTPPGDYSIGLRCGGGNVGVTTTLHVTAGSSATSATSSSTASTTTTTAAVSSSSASAKSSSSPWPWILLAILLVLAALLAGFFVRRRRA
jgi:hypothetical protein